MAGDLKKKKYLFLTGKSMSRYLTAAMSYKPSAISHKPNREV
jgi:hypothetical protein